MKQDQPARDQSALVGQAFDHHADRYAERFMDVQRYTAMLDLFCANLRGGEASVLDLGCGPGNLSRYLASVRPELRITGTDLSERMIDLAHRHVPSGTFQVGDARHPERFGKGFDGVVLGFILPYLHPSETRELFARVAGVLAPKGLLYLATMEGGDDLSGWKQASTGEGPSIFLQYYTAADLTAWLTDSGYELVDLQRTTYVDHHQEEVTDLMILARSGSMR